ncbi:hypothetical protein [Glutamicibacter soli]
MTAQTWGAFQSANENAKGVRKTLGAALFLAPEDAEVPGDLVDATGLMVNSLPTGYLAVGLLSPDGINHERETDSEGVEALGHLAPVREDVTGDSRNITFTALETVRANVVALVEGITLPEVAASGLVKYEVPDFPQNKFYRCVAITFDGSTTEPWFESKFYPRVSVTSFPSEAWSKSDARAFEIGLKAYTDSELGYIKAEQKGGLGFKKNAAALGWTIAP